MKPEEMTILTVDDTPSNIRLLTHYLQKQGYNVLTAEDGFEGFKAAFQYHPDLILLDVMMPGTDGYEVCELLKAEEETKDIPVVFLTAKTDVEDKIRGFELGAVDYITKPFNLIEISTRVESLLKLKYLEEQMPRYQRALDQIQPWFSLGNVGQSVSASIDDILGVLKVNLQKIQKKAVKDDTVQKTAVIALELLARMDCLMERWKGVSHVGEANHAPVDVRDILDETFLLAVDQIGNKAVNVSWDRPDEQAVVCVDAGRLEQALLSVLVLLADLSMDERTMTLCLSMGQLPKESAIRGNNNDTFAEIEIHDPGVSSKMEAIEDELAMVYQTGDYPELGLALSALAGYVRDAGGCMALQTAKGKGATLTFYLPILDA